MANAIDIPPPPGVTPSVWAQLTPQGKQQALARITAQNSAPASALPPGIGPTQNSGAFDETGGGLRPLTPTAAAGIGAPISSIAPQASVPGVTAAQAPLPQGPQLIPYKLPAAGVAPHALGMSPADKEREAQIKGEEETERKEGESRLASAQENVDTFQQQTRALADNAEVARMLHEKEIRDDEAVRRDIESDYKDSATSIQGELNRMQAQGVDPNRYWQNRSTGEKIGMAIAQAAGAFGATLSHGHNFAADILKDAVDQDIRAQEVNLQRGLELTKMKMDVGERGFNVRMAMAKAQRDSRDTAYQIAINQIDKEMATYKDNKVALDGLVNLRSQTEQNRAAAAERHGQELYQMHKAAERVVGGGANDIREKVIKRAQELRDKEGLDPAQAQRVATAEYMGFDAQPGAGPLPAGNPPKNAAGQVSPRLKVKLGEIAAAKEHVAMLKDFLGSGEGSANRFTDVGKGRQAQVAAGELRRMGFTELPENPMGWVQNQAAIRAQLETIDRHLDTQAEVMRSATGAADETPTAEELGGTKD